MFAAESLVRTLINQGVEVCFTNPGTSEMHMVAALDRIEGMRSVLCLFEGVATGAADGYARMAGKPACTLLHLGPGVGNGLANLHNAQRGHAPVVNIVGDHARDHLALDAPLTSDVEGVCRPMSRWVGRVGAPSEVSAMAVEAVRQAYGPERGVASLILPADCAWSDAEPEVLPATAPPAPVRVPADRIGEIAAALESAKSPVILLGNDACLDAGLEAAGPDRRRDRCHAVHGHVRAAHRPRARPGLAQAARLFRRAGARGTCRHRSAGDRRFETASRLLRLSRPARRTDTAGHADPRPGRPGRGYRPGPGGRRRPVARHGPARAG